MLSRLTNVLQQAVEALAPSVSRHEDFVYHWRAVTNYFIDHKHGQAPIEESNIAGHLGEMLKLLVEEECEGEGSGDGGDEGGTTGPCMEYLLQHKLLETLYTLGRTDFPPGMKQAVLSFFTKLLSRIRQPILPHINVHRAVHRLIKICGEVKAGPTEIEEIHFLCTVCAQIKMYPLLTNFFLENVKKDIVITEPLLANKKEFGLISALLSLSHSEDGRVAVKACEGLLLCASLPDPTAAHCIANETPFCQEMTNRLCQLYEKLPRKVDPSLLETVQAKWGLDILPDRDDSTSFPGKRHVISFLSWLDYCDQLMSLSNPVVASRLAASIRDNFLLPIVEPSLLQASETGTMVATLYMTQCLKAVTSPALQSVFLFFLLGEDTAPEQPHEYGHKLRHRLLDHCNHLSDDVTVATLKLFDTLLTKNDAHIVTNLALRNLGDWSHCSTAGATAPTESNDAPGNSENQRHVVTGLPIAASNEAPRIETLAPDSRSETLAPDSRSEETFLTDVSISRNAPGFNLSTASSSWDPLLTSDDAKTLKGVSDGTSFTSPSEDALLGDAAVTLPSLDSSNKDDIQKVINAFLTLLPEGAKSSFQAADAGYDTYLRDAHKQFQYYKTLCEPWGWGWMQSDRPDENAPTFYEGHFLHIILDKLSHLLTQSYEVNLQVTSVVSKLALMPHPALHGLLLDPFTRLFPNVRTPYIILTKVACDIHQRSKSDPQLSAKLVCIRRALMSGDLPTRLLRSPSRTRPRSEDTMSLEAIILLEEFCKELAAIAFVKHHSSMATS